MRNKRRINSDNEAYSSRGMRQDKDSRSVGSQEPKAPGDMSRGNDGSGSRWTPPPSGKPKLGETAGKTKNTNPDADVSSPPSDDSFEPGMPSVPVTGSN